MNKFMRKLWAKKETKKGFTLVELIVVLVILAILAAIMIPSMIGWIDKAKEKQTFLNGRTVLLAAQSAASEAYGEVPAGTVAVADVEGYLGADFPGVWSVTIANARVTEVIYASDGITVTYTPADGWISGGTAPTTNTVN